MLRWFKNTRQTHSKTGFWVHLGGQWIAVAMMIYFWRAIIHLFDAVEAFAGGWQRSQSEHLGILEGLWAVPVHMLSEPVYCLQLAAILFVLHLTVNREGYRTSAVLPNHYNSGGLGVLAVMSVFRR